MAYSQSYPPSREDIRRRGIAIIIALTIEAVLFIAIWSLGMQSSSQLKSGSTLTAFNIPSAASAAPAAATQNKPVVQNPDQVIAPTPPIPPPLLPSPNKLNLPPPPPPGDYIKVSKSEFEAMDLSKFPGSGGAGTSGAGKGGRGTMGPGEGPGGEQLYPVAWYREPTDAELGPYLKEAKRVPPGAWAEIACRMIEHYHVENCRPLGESPRGSGLAKALRRASWQFLVKPPREGSKVLLGTWVRIRFDFRRAEVVADGASE
jgi:hypothetical protein